MFKKIILATALAAALLLAILFFVIFSPLNLTSWIAIAALALIFIALILLRLKKLAGIPRSNEDWHFF